MAGKNSQEEEVIKMKRYFGGLVSLIKDLKVKVEQLEIKMEPNKIVEVKEIIDKQKILDDIISANTDSIKRIDCESEY